MAMLLVGVLGGVLWGAPVLGALPWTPCSYSVLHNRGLPIGFNLAPTGTSIYTAQVKINIFEIACTV